ncbi:hypothetical protein EDC01DRAFT_744311 [Geopyxis carbonaria]|nr:hypothetical protein EDC01DRAFT_744311 [Geopyxis carbonaria]
MHSLHSLALTLALALPLTHAHIGLWHPAALDFGGDGYSLVEPLSGKSVADWWFHGNLDKADAALAAEPMSLPAGGAVTVELACNKDATSYGSNPSDSPCPTDQPSMHAGDDGADVLGCGLAIAYKSTFAEVQPADFTVFSVAHDCVRTRETAFQVPANLPACAGGNCICAWFWQGQQSADEMYMTGFACNVEGGGSGTLAPPQPPVRCEGGTGCVKGAKQPLYWANDGGNLDGQAISYDAKPAYNDNWGFPDGAQELGLGAGSGNASSGNTSSGNTSSSNVSSEATGIMSILPVETEAASSDTQEKPYTPPTPPIGTGTGNTASTLTTMTKPATATATAPTYPGSDHCAWPGHCEGATCIDEHDCSDSLVDGFNEDWIFCFLDLKRFVIGGCRVLFASTDVTRYDEAYPPRQFLSNPTHPYINSSIYPAILLTSTLAKTNHKRASNHNTNLPISIPAPRPSQA